MHFKFMRNISLVVISLVIFTNTRAQEQIVIGKPTGNNDPVSLFIKVTDAETGEPISRVNCRIAPIAQGFSTDLNGEYELSLYNGKMTFTFSHLGYFSKSYIVLLVGPGSLEIQLESSIKELEEIIVTGNSDQNVKSTTVGKNELNIESIKALPLFAGQVDVIKSLTLLPGVTSVGEVSSGLNVRGSQTDNNLILLGGAPIYNPSHLFGFFSGVNGDVVRNVSLYKGGIPARYGGRSSSVLDITTKYGDFNDWSGELTAGIVSSSASIDGPIIKDKLSLSIGGRVSYIDWLLQQSKEESINSSNASFYDINSTISFRPSFGSKFDYRMYYSFDDFNFISDTLISWTNFNHTLDWDYVVGDNTYLNINLTNSNYEYAIKNTPGLLGFEQTSRISDTRLNVDLLIDFDDNKSLNFGLNSSYLSINPGTFRSKGNSNFSPVDLDNEKALELAGYIAHKRNIGERFAIEAGIRFNHYSYLGPGEVNLYQENLPRAESTITSVESYGNNETIESYQALNPRLGLRYSITDDLSVKGGVNRLSQYIHLISNTTTLAPTDIWKLSDNHIRPNESWIFSLGLFKDITEKYEISAEVYYKPILSIIEYKDGANLNLNQNIETELLNADGEARGIEFYLRKYGRLSGWLSYTYGRSLRRVRSAFENNSINNGDWFPSNFDTPHNLSVTLRYLIRKGVEFSSTFVYSDGRPASIPSGRFNYQGQTVAYFNERNGFRIPDYHRLDISWTWDLNSEKKLLDGDFTFSVYNVYSRRNAFSLFFDDVFGQEPQAFKLSILGSIFPSVSYRVKFL